MGKVREKFEALWLQGGGNFKYFEFNAKHGKYLPTGFKGSLTDSEIFCASLAVNTAYLFYLGGFKQAKTEIMLDKPAQGVSESQWIDASKRNPEIGMEVLVCWANDHDLAPEIDYMDTHVDTGNYIWANSWCYVPTHWMPIPKPPQAQEEN